MWGILKFGKFRNNPDVPNFHFPPNFQMYKNMFFHIFKMYKYTFPNCQDFQDFQMFHISPNSKMSNLLFQHLHIFHFPKFSIFPKHPNLHISKFLNFQILQIPFHELLLLHVPWAFYARQDAQNIIRSPSVRHTRFREQSPMIFRVGPLGP